VWPPHKRKHRISAHDNRQYSVTREQIATAIGIRQHDAQHHTSLLTGESARQCCVRAHRPPDDRQRRVLRRMLRRERRRKTMLWHRARRGNPGGPVARGRSRMPRNSRKLLADRGAPHRAPRDQIARHI